MWFNHKNSLGFGIFATLFVVADGFCAAPFSQYGMIQNVQSYSSNPFYNSDTATITSPKIISASGPDLKASDCQAVVKSLIELECATRNSCVNTKMTDIRPSLMVKLSSLPGHSYATTCSGYIDYAFTEYVKSHKAQNYLTPQTYNSFPVVVGGNTVRNIAPSASSANTPIWQNEYNERANELRALQQTTNTSTYAVNNTDFPKVFEDLSFEQQNDIKKQGYEPYKNALVYAPITVEIDEEAANKRAKTIQDIENCIEKLKNKAQRLQSEAERALDAAEQLNDVDMYATQSDIQTLIKRAELLMNHAEEAAKEATDAACSCSFESSMRARFLLKHKIQCDSKQPKKVKI